MLKFGKRISRISRKKITSWTALETVLFSISFTPKNMVVGKIVWFIHPLETFYWIFKYPDTTTSACFPLYYLFLMSDKILALLQYQFLDCQWYDTVGSRIYSLSYQSRLKNCKKRFWPIKKTRIMQNGSLLKAKWKESTLSEINITILDLSVASTQASLLLPTS